MSCFMKYMGFLKDAYKWTVFKSDQPLMHSENIAEPWSLLTAIKFGKGKIKCVLYISEGKKIHFDYDRENLNLHSVLKHCIRVAKSNGYGARQQRQPK